MLSTVWDSPADAAEFANAMRDWIAAGEEVAEVSDPSAGRVDVLFASDRRTLDALRTAA
jgi:hypothetical protein